MSDRGAKAIIRDLLKYEPHRTVMQIGKRLERIGISPEETVVILKSMVASGELRTGTATVYSLVDKQLEGKRR